MFGQASAPATAKSQIQLAERIPFWAARFAELKRWLQKWKVMLTAELLNVLEGRRYDR